MKDGVCGVLETMDWEKQTRVIVKLLNCMDSQYILEKKHKLRNIALLHYIITMRENSNSRKIFINQSLRPYYRRLYGLVKDFSNKSLIDSFWILDGTINIRESSQSKPVSITHESDLQF